jgi:hypothetical protein
LSKAEELFALAQTLADERPRLFEILGAGQGDHESNSFTRTLRERATQLFSYDHSERRISGDNRLAVDFYFQEEVTIVEVALSLRNPQGEFERDILKALMAQEIGNEVGRLFFISKPGALARCARPGTQAIMSWARRMHKLEIEVQELVNNHAA